MNDKRVNQYLILPGNGQRKDTKLAVEYSEEQIAELLKQGYVIVNHDDFFGKTAAAQTCINIVFFVFSQKNDGDIQFFR